jgi:hypothetical protein
VRFTPTVSPIRTADGLIVSHTLSASGMGRSRRCHQFSNRGLMLIEAIRLSMFGRCFSSALLVASITRSVTLILNAVTRHWSRRSVEYGSTSATRVFPRSCQLGVIEIMEAIAIRARGISSVIPHELEISGPMGGLNQPRPL